MIIQSGNIGMSGSRRYASHSMSVQSMRVWGTHSAAVSDSTMQTGQTFYGGTASAGTNTKNGFSKNLLQQFQASQNVQGTRRIRKAEDLQNLAKIREQTLNYLLNVLLGQDSRMNQLSQLNTEDMEQPFGGQYVSEFYHTEQETTTFSAEGIVRTLDGREISFQTELTMSRSFTERAATAIDFGAARLLDPLVINLDVPAANVSDQKFFFDLDADGHEEAISKLGAGSGFLALDKNGDGTINDGSELFGALSGNGFADLSRYDSDGNGWIDEADEIFDQLLIWSKDANGRDQLVGLGKAGVGAIYLSAQKTDFSMNNAHNETNAVVRQTGIFLYENGGTGTIQQLDLAT